MMTNAKRLKADLTLLLVAVIWGSAFSAQRVAAETMPFFLYNGLRFALGALTVFLLMKLQNQRVFNSISQLELIGGCICGFLIFGGSNFQQAGLHLTTAGKAGFITGLYVVLVPLFISIIALVKPSNGRRTPHWSAWLAAIIAAIGLFLLSATETFTLAFGDVIVLGGTSFWALHILAVGYLAPQVKPMRLAFIQYFTCAFLNLLASLILESTPLSAVLEVWWTIAYVGIFSVGIAYTLQVVGQQEAPEADAAIIMSLEAVFAALFGWWLLSETLTRLQLFGCGLMLLGMLLAQVGERIQFGQKIPSPSH